MTFPEIQQLARTCLAANAAFAGVPFFLELDETATPDQLAAFEAGFYAALNSLGVAVVIACPELATIDRCEASAVATQLAVGIAICENPEVNRGAADATAIPPRTPLGKSCGILVEQAIVALIPEFIFPPQPAGRPTPEQGYWAYDLVVLRKHLIRGASPA